MRLMNEVLQHGPSCPLQLCNTWLSACGNTEIIYSDKPSGHLKFSALLISGCDSVKPLFYMLSQPPKMINMGTIHTELYRGPRLMPATVARLMTKARLH